MRSRHGIGEDMLVWGLVQHGGKISYVLTMVPCMHACFDDMLLSCRNRAWMMFS